MIRFFKQSRIALLLAVITLLGLGLRFWKINYGLPDVTFTNEEITCYPTLNMVSQGFNPRHFIHPHLYYYIWFFFDAIFILFSLATGRFHVPYDAWILYKTNPTVYFVIGRSIAAVLGTFTIPLTYAAGKKLFDEKTGMIAAFFLAVSFIHVQWSQIAYMDVPLAFFVTLTFIFALRALETGKLSDFVWAGVFGGLATSTKYYAVPIALWGPLACFLRRDQRKENVWAAFWDKRVLVFYLVFFTAFTLGTPFWILDFPEFKRQFLMMTSWFRPRGQGHMGIEGDWNWGYYLFTTLPYSVGLPILISGLGGMLMLIRRVDPKKILFLSFPLVYFFLAGITKIRQSKYLMPMIPFLCISAAFFLVLMVESWKGKRKNKNAILFALVLLAAIPTLESVLRYNHLKTFTDARQQAIDWVDAHVSPESKMLVGNNTMWHRVGGPKTFDMDPGLTDQKLLNQTTLRKFEDYRKDGFDYIVLDEWHLGLLFSEEADNPRYQEAIRRYKKFLEDLKKSAELVATFSPYREENVKFDRENAFVASRSLRKLKSHGPLIQIYKLNR